MTYISRRLSVTSDTEEVTEYVDTDFFTLDAPLIVLGEPGSGKTVLVKRVEDTLRVPYYNASTIESLPSIDTMVIVDGVDEITAYETGTPINKILAKLPQNSHFVLTCRAADWQDVINTRIIQQKWQKKPVIGRLLPLNHREIVDFVNTSDGGQDGESFIQEAQRHGVVALLENPQNLTMLLKAVQTSGWPDTRLKLYEDASIGLVKEDNDCHQSINRTRPAFNTLIEAAGFIFTQLLLSETSYVQIDGSGDVKLPSAIDLASDDLNESIIRSALSTNVFRVAKNNILEACHRTIAEFLAAKWLTDPLKNRLSLRRFESLLYGNGYIVPAALRGLHAWIATLNPALAGKFITRDPYGFFLYGDPAALTIPQSVNLLHCLERAAEADPHFRNGDWHATFGRGLARPELRNEMIRVIRNPNVSYQLSHLLIESIQGTPFVNNIADDLLELILDPTVTPLVRHEAAKALLVCETQIGWHKVVDQLMQSADIESLRIALEIVGENITDFDGIAIANLLLDIAEAINTEDGPTYTGLGNRLHKKMSSEQLETSLEVLSQHQTEQARETRRRRASPEKWVFRFSQERLSRGEPPSAQIIYSWFRNADWRNHDRSDWDRLDWDTFAAEYFSQHANLRQAIQTEGLSHVTDKADYWRILVGYECSPWWFREDDIIFHMNMLLEAHSQYADWPLRWRHLVHWARMRSNFADSAIELAQMHATDHPELQEQLDWLERPPPQDFDREQSEWVRKHKQNRQREMQTRHKSFEHVREKLGTGQDLGALGQVANAYLGRYSDPRESRTPIDRVTELVGSKMVSTAFEGLSAVMQRDDIPTAREIIELHANEQKEHFFEPILLVHCELMLQSTQDLSELPLTIAHAALAACDWDVSGDKFTSGLQQHLELRVFENRDSKITFIQDTMEPYLNAGADHIGGLYRLARTDEFSDVAGGLAIEWLNQYSSLSSNSLQDLLIAAIRYAPREEVTALIRGQIENEQWNSEEQRHMWMGSAFLLDYTDHSDLLISYASEESKCLWAFKAMIHPERENNECWPELDESQLHFLITQFGPMWPPVDTPSGVWIGKNNPWDASRFIEQCIGSLAAQLSDKAEKLLSGLINATGLEGYQDYIRHVYAQSMRQRAEKNKTLLPLDGLRKILLKGEPATLDDLQALLMDELEALQDRIRNSTTNDILPFWNGDSPHAENYCRDRIAAALTPYLNRFRVCVHTEGTMPDHRRCDLLITHGMMGVPIEIKGQWHSEIWTAATEQLPNYTREYRAKGRGIYLVLWFGLTNHTKSRPRGWQGQAPPGTLDEMNTLLCQRYKDISEKTKLFVLDLSKPC